MSFDIFNTNTNNPFGKSQYPYSVDGFEQNQFSLGAQSLFGQYQNPNNRYYGQQESMGTGYLNLGVNSLNPTSSVGVNVNPDNLFSLKINSQPENATFIDSPLDNSKLFGTDNPLGVLYEEDKMKEVEEMRRRLAEAGSKDIADSSLPELREELPEDLTEKEANNFNGTNFMDFLASPQSRADVDLNTSLFLAGKSFGFKPSVIQNPEARNQARRGNIARGVGAVGKSVLNIGRLVGAGLGYENRLMDYYNNFDADKRQALVGTYRFENGGLLQYLKNGGTIEELPVEKIMTGEYLQALPKKQQDKANAELEKKEYVQHPDGDVQEVVGKTHPQGGVKVKLQDGTKVISNNLKLGGEGAKNCRDKFDIKVGAKDTYARAVEKYTTKIGLKKLNEEQVQLFKKLKQQKDVTDNATAQLNIEFLSAEIQEIDKKKEILEEKRKEFVSYVFDKQEKSKGIDTSNIPTYKDGGLHSNISALAKKYNLSEQEASKLLNDYAQSNNIPKLTDGDLFEQSVNSFRSGEYGNQRFTKFNNSLTSGDVNQDSFLARIQETLRIFPQAEKFLNLQTNQDGTIVGAEFKDKSSVQGFQKYVQNVYTNLLDYGGQNITDADELKRFNDYVGQLGFNNNTARGLDNIWGDFSSSRSGVNLRLVDQKELDELNKLGITNFSQVFDDQGNIKEGVELSDKTRDRLSTIRTQYGDVFEAGLLPINAENPATPPAEVEKIVEEAPPTVPPEPTAQTEIEAGDFSSRERRNGIPYLPDQSTLPPDAVNPHVKIERQFERLDPFEVTNEENLKEIFRSQNFSTEQLNNLPDAQRRAVLATMTANTQENINKTVTSTNIANAQNFQATEQFNIGQSNAEENARASDTLDFERRQLTSLDNTKLDLANYLDYNKRVRLGNLNTIKQYNMLNSYFDEFGVDMFGNVQFDPLTNTSI